MKQELYIKLMNCPAPQITEEIRIKLEQSPDITPLAFSDKNRLLWDTTLQNETGFIRLPSGCWLVAMKTEMPGITREMIDWWFWWHPQEKERYQVWFPGEHFNIGFAAKNANYFREPFIGFKPNMQYPVERIGAAKAYLSIRFLTSQQFGFDESLFLKNGIETLICGHVGLLKGVIEHTEMSHIFKKNQNGLTLISRFWIGEHLPKMVWKKIANKNLAFELAEHCSREYTNLSIILPELYRNYYDK